MSTVLDSSRYFVLRIEDQGRHAFIGIGFNERDEAFDFKVALTDHNRVEANVAAAKALLDSAAPKEDLGLKDGQKIVVKLSGKVKNPDKKQPNKLGGGYSGVAPPPARSAAGISAPPSSSISAPPRAVAPPASAPAPVAATTHTPPAQQAPPAQQPAAQQPNLFGALPAAPATSAPAAAAQPNLFSTPAPTQPAGTANLFAAGNGSNLFASTPTPAAAAAPPPQPSNSGFNDLFAGVSNTAPPAAAPAQQAQPNMFAPQQQQQQQQPPQQPSSGGDLLDFGPSQQVAKSSVCPFHVTCVPSLPPPPQVLDCFGGLGNPTGQPAAAGDPTAGITRQMQQFDPFA